MKATENNRALAHFHYWAKALFKIAFIITLAKAQYPFEQLHLLEFEVLG